MPEFEPPSQISMIRNHLDDLPPMVLPDGYVMRSFQDGDDEIWQGLIGRAFGEVVNGRTYDQDIRKRAGYAPKHSYFMVAPNGTVCATASGVAGHNASQGYVHWVAVDSNHKGKALGYWVSLQVLHGFLEAGKTHAFLDTDVFRIPAIKTYLRLGFTPYITKPYQFEHWQDIVEDFEVDRYWATVEKN